MKQVLLTAEIFVCVPYQSVENIVLALRKSDFFGGADIALLPLGLGTLPNLLIIEIKLAIMLKPSKCTP